MKPIVSALIVVGIIIGIINVAAYVGYKSYQMYKPKYTEVDNTVFHESQQYNDGMMV